MLGTAYKLLLAKLEDAKLAADVERRQIGEQFRMIEPARIPEKPLGAARGGLTFVGAVAGLCLGLQSSWFRLRRRWRSAETEVLSAHGGRFAPYPSAKSEAPCDTFPSPGDILTPTFRTD